MTAVRMSDRHGLAVLYIAVKLIAVKVIAILI
jgi:hypothetical protein